MMNDLLFNFFDQAYRANELRENGEIEKADLLCEFLPEVFVAPYIHDRAYGGPEEGGWWFDTHSPIEDKKYTGEYRYKIMRLDNAVNYAKRANQLCKKFVNDGKHPMDSVNCEGLVVYVITEGEPHHMPETKPHWE